MRNQLRWAVTLLIAVLFLTACSATGDADETAQNAGNSDDSASAEPAAVTFNVKPGETDVAVDRVLSVDVAGGKLNNVNVRLLNPEDNEPAKVPGKLRDASWQAKDLLEPGGDYRIVAKLSGPNGKERKEVRNFHTVALTLDQQTYPSMAPLDGETVGVGMPVIVKFDLAVSNRAAIERHLQVKSVPKQRGSWHWLNDSEVHWRPAKYWQPGTKVTVNADINGVPAGGGIYGQLDRTISFDIGEKVVHKVRVGGHVMRTFINGNLAHTAKISGGKAGFETRSGIKLIMAKHRHKTMDAATTGIEPGDPEYYNIEDVEYAMRVTSSGEFLHAAPWSVGAQGSANVSHGCVGMSTADAAWAYNHSKRGDVVDVTGSNRQMTLENGYGDWNLSFAEYKQGSAL